MRRIIALNLMGGLLFLVTGCGQSPTTGNAPGSSTPRGGESKTSDTGKGAGNEKALESLQGTWKMVSGKYQGEDLKAEVVTKGRLVIEGTTFKLASGFSDTEYLATVQLDATKKPAHLDLTAGGSNPKAATPAIYELDGDTLKLCWDRGGEDQPRPKGFESPKGSDVAVFVLNRVKK